jgi:hypothetical protein
VLLNQRRCAAARARGAARRPEVRRMWGSAFTPLLLAAAALQAPRHRPLYPLYAMITGTANYTDADTEQIASNFEFSQGTGTAGFRAALRKIYPPFRTVMYSNPSGTGTAMNGPGGGLANMQAFERSHRCDTGNGWYVAGRLARAISQDTTQIHVVADAKKIGVVPAVPRGVLLSASTQGSGLYSRFSRGNPGRFEWVVYARLGDELMKVLSIRSTSGGNLTTLTVSRGFDRSQAAAHAVGEVVLAPLYESVPACQACPHQDLSYGLMASTTLASDYLINFTCNALAAGYDGSWYDNFGSGIFTVHTATGLALGVQDFYDAEEKRYWNATTYLQAQRRRLDRAFAGIVAKYPNERLEGRRPAILANGFWSGFGKDPVSAGFVMMQNGSASAPVDVAPAAFRLDGWCKENFYMQEHGPCGYDSVRSYLDENQWLKNVQSVAAAAQINAAVFPTIGGAGCGSQAMEANPHRTRDEGAFYASFLLAVEKTAAQGGRPCAGLQPLYYTNPNSRTSTRYAAIHPRFHWPIGPPAETKPVAEYRLPALHACCTYARRFATGLVLINPSWNQTDSLDLGTIYPSHQYADPGNQIDTGGQFPSVPKAVRRLSVPPQTAFILLV